MGVRRARGMKVVAMASVAGDAAKAAADARVPDPNLPSVLVAGGGIAGLICALALQRKAGGVTQHGGRALFFGASLPRRTMRPLKKLTRHSARRGIVVADGVV